MEIEEIFKHNSKWIQQQLNVDKDYFVNLGKGQSPEFLYIGCSDSRVTAEALLGAKPGEVFVHRNIANLAPNNELNVLSVINYSVAHLKVKHIIVCGHYGCGGVKAAMQPIDLGLLNPWLRNIRDVYRLHKNELDAIESDAGRYDRLVELNVIEQCINVAKTLDVQKAYMEREIHIHGWVFDVHSGRIVNLNVNLEEIMTRIRDVYQHFPNLVN